MPAPESLHDTRVLVLTDVVDSTKLSEALGDVAMSELWARHDRVARDLLVAHGGLEIDKTDGFLLLFDAAEAAIAYALAYHRALEPLGIQARAGVHRGPVVLRANPPDDVARGAKPLEVDGLARPIAARVMSLARGGQALVTEEAAASMAGLHAHGHWRVKGGPPRGGARDPSGGRKPGGGGGRAGGARHAAPGARRPVGGPRGDRAGAGDRARVEAVGG